MSLALEHLGNDYAGKPARDLFLLGHTVNLDSNGCHDIRNLHRSKIAIYILFKPTV